MSKKNEQANVTEISVKIEGSDWESAINKAFEKKSKEVKVDGFRKGKIPREVYDKKFGKESLFVEAADLVLQQAYIKAMDDSKLIPVIQPSVDLVDLDESGVTFKFVITTKPEVVVKNYKGLGVKKEVVKVTKAEVDTEVKNLLDKYTEMATKEGKVESGDTAIINFEGFKDGVAFDGGFGENYSLEIGSNTFIPGFEDQVIGMEVDEEKEINVVFPKEYGAEDLAGKDAMFKVKVLEIKEKIARELDKDFFADLAMPNVEDEESLKTEIKKSITAHKEMEVENKYVDKLLEAVSKNVEVDIPQGMIDEEIERLMSKFEEQIKMQGISLDLYYQFTKSDEAALKEQLSKEANSNVLYRLMLEKIMEVEKVEISEADAKNEVKELADKYKVTEEEFLAQFGGIEMIQYDLEMRKTIEILKELNK